MSEIATVGLDLAKHVFQVHGADASGRMVLRKKLRRNQVLAFFSQLPCCVVAMEACGGAHFWGREIGKMGHEVRLIPPAYVKPVVKPACAAPSSGMLSIVMARSAPPPTGLVETSENKPLPRTTSVT